MNKLQISSQLAMLVSLEMWFGMVNYQPAKMPQLQYFKEDSCVSKGRINHTFFLLLRVDFKVINIYYYN